MTQITSIKTKKMTLLTNSCYMACTFFKGELESCMLGTSFTNNYEQSSRRTEEVESRPLGYDKLRSTLTSIEKISTDCVKLRKGHELI